MGGGGGGPGHGRVGEVPTDRRGLHHKGASKRVDGTGSGRRIAPVSGGLDLVAARRRPENRERGAALDAACGGGGPAGTRVNGQNIRRHDGVGEGDVPPQSEAAPRAHRRVRAANGSPVPASPSSVASGEPSRVRLLRIRKFPTQVPWMRRVLP